MALEVAEHALVVAYEHEGGAERACGGDECVDRMTCTVGVEACGGFVREDDRGRLHQHAHERRALHLASREEFGARVGIDSVQLEEVRRVATLGVGYGARAEREGEQDVFEGREAVEEAEVLKEEADVPAAPAVAPGFGECGDLGVAVEHAAPRREKNARDELEEGGLARAACAAHGDHFTGFEAELVDLEERAQGGAVANVESDAFKLERVRHQITSYFASASRTRLTNPVSGSVSLPVSSRPVTSMRRLFCTKACSLASLTRMMLSGQS